MYKTLDRLSGALAFSPILNSNAILENSRVRSMRLRSPLKRPGHTIVYGNIYLVMLHYLYSKKDTFPGRSRGLAAVGCLTPIRPAKDKSTH